jgi:hypothetical protein
VDLETKEFTGNHFTILLSQQDLLHGLNKLSSQVIESQSVSGEIHLDRYPGNNASIQKKCLLGLSST